MTPDREAESFVVGLGLLFAALVLALCCWGCAKPQRHPEELRRINPL